MEKVENIIQESQENINKPIFKFFDKLQKLE